jgi:hypothetical protein
LIQFKRGAFASLTPVKPLYTITGKDSFQLALGSMNISLHCYLTLCFLYHKIEFVEMPIVTPTEFLYQNFAHLGRDKVEIFQEVSGYKTSKHSYDRKFAYLSDIKGENVKNT